MFARGNNRGRIFLDDTDHRIYLVQLRHVIEEQSLRCLAYCLMPNHVHLLVETPLGNLSDAIHQLHCRYALTFNRRHERSGHVFQGRFGSVHIDSDHQLCATAIYIAKNPVEASLTQRADQWPWSSCRDAILGGRDGLISADRLFSAFGSNSTDGRKNYASLVLAEKT